jgi:hypothetical protein
MNKMISLKPNSVALVAHQNVGNTINTADIVAPSGADNLPDTISDNSAPKDGIDSQVQGIQVNGEHVSDTPLERLKTAEVIQPSSVATQAHITEHPTTVDDAHAGQFEEINVPEFTSQPVSVFTPVNSF